MKRGILWLIFFASLVGIVSALIATVQYFHILDVGFEDKSFCSINAFLNCDAAHASQYAKIFGLPVAWLGFLYFLWIGVTTLNLLFSKQPKWELASFAWLLSLFGLLFTLFEAFISLTVLEVLCLICLTMYIAVFLIFFGFHFLLKIGFKNFSNLKLAQKWKSLGAAAILFFGIGALGIHGYQTSLRKRMELRVPIKEIVSYHYRQSEYQLEPDLQKPLWGNPNSKITIIEFADFQCPLCKEAAFHLKSTLSEFKNQIRFLFYYYPLDPVCNKQVQTNMHPEGCLSAFASVCAEKLGDFWGFHDEIFRNQEKLSRELLIKLAKEKGWDEASFTQCLSDPEIEKVVQKDIEAGQKIYITGTPTILINNRRLKYWSHPEVVRAILKEEFKRTSNQK